MFYFVKQNIKCWKPESKKIKRKKLREYRQNESWTQWGRKEERLESKEERDDDFPETRFESGSGREVSAAFHVVPEEQQ